MQLAWHKSSLQKTWDPKLIWKDVIYTLITSRAHALMWCVLAFLP